MEVLVSWGVQCCVQKGLGAKRCLRSRILQREVDSQAMVNNTVMGECIFLCCIALRFCLKGAAECECICV